MVTPLSWYGGRPITPDEAKVLHQGPRGKKYSDRDFSQYVDQLQLANTEEAKTLAAKNAKKTGKDLTAWIDELTQYMWHISDTCIDSSTLSSCSRLPSCQKTSWSSLSPDPKSFIGSISKLTGRLR